MLPRAPIWCLPLAIALACTGKKAKRDDDRPEKAAAIDAGAAGKGGVRLTVLVVIDQLPTWSFDPMHARLKGGIGRMIAEGTYYVRAELPYSNTFTASGHAAIATGAPPAVSGIVANDWHRSVVDEDEAAADKVGSCDDPECPLLGPAPAAGEGRSSTWLAVDGVADMLERETGGAARTVAISLKDRGAILVIGKKPDLALWWDSDQAIMTTSSFYAKELPAWATIQRGGTPLARQLLEQTWQPSDPALLAELAGGGDDGPGEGGNDHLGNTFPYALKGVEQPAKALLNTPFATELLFETAAAAIDGEGLGQDAVPDLLALSVSSHDYAGHGWGQESWERVDVLLDIDRRLGLLFEQLDAKVGRGKWAALLTSDHGATRLEVRQAAAGVRTWRVAKETVAAAVDKAMRRVLGGRGPFVRGMSGNLIHLTPEVAAAPPDRRQRAVAAGIAAVRAIPGIGLVDEATALSGDCTRHADAERQRACRSIPTSITNAIYALTKPGSQYISDHVGGAGHGNASEDERLVPILIVAPGRPAARREEPVSFLRVAPTISALVGAPSPPAATEPPLE